MIQIISPETQEMFFAPKIDFAKHKGDKISQMSQNSRPEAAKNPPRPDINLWINGFLAAALVFAAKYAYSEYQEYQNQRQADEFWAGVSPTIAAIWGFCTPNPLPYQVQPGDGVESIARQAGIAGTIELGPVRLPGLVPDGVLDGLNPWLPTRENRWLFPEDKLLLPPDPAVWDFLDRQGQNPHQLTADWLTTNDPEAVPLVRARAEAVFGHLSGNWTTEPVSEEVIRDLCIWRLYADPRAEVTVESVEQALGSYYVRFQLNPFIELLERISDIETPFLNNILAAAGIEQRLPENIGESAIYAPRVNAIGGGEGGMKRFFLIYGNYEDLETDALGRVYTTNRLLSETGTTTWSMVKRPFFHEAGHANIQPDDWENYLTRPQWNFAHSGMGLWTMSLEMYDRDFVPYAALDSRVQYVFHTLIHSQTTGGQSAYLRMLRGVMRFQDVDKIAATYDQFRQYGDPAFAELFAGESPWVFDNSPYGKYLAGRDDPQSEYQKDVDRLRLIILPLMTSSGQFIDKPADHNRAARIIDQNRQPWRLSRSLN